MKPNIHLHIDQLVLRGLDLAPGERHRLQASVEAEMTRLLAQGGLAPELLRSASPTVSAQSVQYSSGQDTAQLGQKIARSVYGGIGHE